MRGASPRRAVRAAILPAAALCGCATGRAGYAPAGAGADPYASLRDRAEAESQAGPARERAGDWRAVRRNYEQAQLWDPGGRQEIRAGVAHARAMVAALDSAMPAPTPTFRPGASPAGGPAPAASAASRNLGQAPPPAKPAAAAGYRALRSATLPSAIAYPIGWGGELGGAGGDEGRSDRFVAPGAEGIAASVAVAGLALPGGAGDETFVARKVAALRGATDFRELAPRTVGGMAAVVVSFVTARAGESRIAVRAFCAGDGIGWQLTILARPDDLAGAMIVSGAMLASFEPGGGR